jgi:NADH:ubiquinone oxidoreductase subunit 3 (subunit A)
MADILSGGLGTVTTLGNNAVNMLVLVLAGLILVAIMVGILLTVMQARKYNQYKIVIFQNDGFGHTSWRTDDGGVFVDRKTGNKRLYLKSSHVGLEPDNIPFIPTTKGNRIVMLLQTGLKNYKYIHPLISADQIRFTVGEEDVNWAVNEYEAQKKRFNTNWLTQYMPFIILGFCFIVLAILMVSIFQKIPMIKDLADTMLKVAQALQQANSHTTIIP